MMNSTTSKEKMNKVSSVAFNLELTSSHYFGQTDPATKRRHNLATSPSLSHSGGRAVFDNGTGSAIGSPCVWQGKDQYEHYN